MEEKSEEVSYRLSHKPNKPSLSTSPFLACTISLDFIVSENCIQRKEETLLLKTCTYVQLNYDKDEENRLTSSIIQNRTAGI